MLLFGTFIHIVDLWFIFSGAFSCLFTNIIQGQSVKMTFCWFIGFVSPLLGHFCTQLSFTSTSVALGVIKATSIPPQRQSPSLLNFLGGVMARFVGFCHVFFVW